MESDLDLPAELVESFKHSRVALLIGAGCSKSAGFPDWPGLLSDIREVYEREGMLDDGDRARIKNWWQEPQGFSRIAQHFHHIAPERYRRLMQDTFDPADTLSLRVPQYFDRFTRLPLTRILTTNFDPLLEISLGQRWSSVTWRDQSDFARYLRDPRPLIFHLHGRADRFDTLVHTSSEYQALQGGSGARARLFLKTIFETHTILAIGYRLGDPVMQWLYDRLVHDWDYPPVWYALTPNPSKTQRRREREKRQLQLLAYPLDSPATDRAHENGLCRWFEHLMEELGINAQNTAGDQHPAVNEPPRLESSRPKAAGGESAEDIRRPAATQPTRAPATPAATATKTDIEPSRPRRTRQEGETTQSSGSECLHSDGSALVYVPAGEYTLGAPDITATEQPVHRVRLSDFWIGKHSVTNEQYRQFLEANPSQEPPEFWENERLNRPQQPVVGVSWEDTWAYCAWAGLMLPSEAQWEAAARGSNLCHYPWGNEAPTPELANFGNHVGRTSDCGSYPAGASPFGALDMAGNVWEWCADTWDPDAYQRREGQVDPILAIEGPETRVIRGGSWSDESRFMRSAFRIWLGSGDRHQFLGFRVCYSESNAVPGKHPCRSGDQEPQ